MRNRLLSSILLFIITMILLMESACGRSPVKTSEYSASSIVLSSGEKKTAAQERHGNNSNSSDNTGMPAESSANGNNSNAPTATKKQKSTVSNNHYSAGTIKNILLIGQDRRSKDPELRRSDCMIILSFNTYNNTIKLLSLMRDMYIRCADGTTSLINATYYRGDFQLLDRTIEESFGIHIDGNMELDFFRFFDFFNCIGPVTIDLNTEETNYLNSPETHKWIAQAGVDNTGWALHTGNNAMTSGQLLSYARTRYIGRSDFERTERQRKIVMASIHKLLGYDTSALVNTAQKAIPYLRTDMSASELIDIAKTIRNKGAVKFETSRIPIDESYTQEIREGDLHVLIPDINRNREYAVSFIYP